MTEANEATNQIAEIFTTTQAVPAPASQQPTEPPAALISPVTPESVRTPEVMAEPTILQDSTDQPPLEISESSSMPLTLQRNLTT